MKKTDLSDAFKYVDEESLQEVEAYRSRKRGVSPMVVKLLAAAAAVGLITGLAFLLPNLRKATSTAISPDKTATQTPDKTATQNTAQNPDQNIDQNTDQNTDKNTDTNPSQTSAADGSESDPSRTEADLGYIQGVLCTFETGDVFLIRDKIFYRLRNDSEGAWTLPASFSCGDTVRIGYTWEERDKTLRFSDIRPITCEAVETGASAPDADVLHQLGELGWYSLIDSFTLDQPILIMGMPDVLAAYPCAIEYSVSAAHQPYSGEETRVEIMMTLRDAEHPGKGVELPLAAYTLTDAPLYGEEGQSIARLLKEYKNEDTGERRYLCLQSERYGLYYIRQEHPTFLLGSDDLTGSSLVSFTLTDDELLTLAEAQSGLTPAELTAYREAYQQAQAADASSGTTTAASELLSRFLNAYDNRMITASRYLYHAGMAGYAEYLYISPADIEYQDADAALRDTDCAWGNMQKNIPSGYFMDDGKGCCSKKDGSFAIYRNVSQC